MLLSIQILIQKVLKNCFFQLLARFFGFGECFFSIQITLKKIEKLIFAAFGKILALANAFFYSNSNSKSIEKLIFAAFGKILVLVNVFSLKKVLKNCFFHLLARCWFWRMLFSIQILLRKYGKIDFLQFLARFLVLVNAFFLFKF